MISELLTDHYGRVLLGVVVVNLMILLWLGRAWLIGTSPKTSRGFALCLLAICVIIVLNALLERFAAQ